MSERGGIGHFVVITHVFSMSWPSVGGASGTLGRLRSYNEQLSMNK
jgi:hypothetical protein